MAPTLYYYNLSPPSRAVLMVAKTIGLELNVRIIDLRKKEQLSPEFLKLNPQHCLPTLVDGNFVIWDSHAILGYFIHKYARNDSLYPREPHIRAIIDQRLHFETGHLFQMLKETMYPMILENQPEVPERARYKLEDTYGLVDKFLAGNQWVAGTDLSIADYSFFAIIIQLDVFVRIDKVKYVNIRKWLERCERLRYSELNKEGNEMFRKAMADKFRW